MKSTLIQFKINLNNILKNNALKRLCFKIKKKSKIFFCVVYLRMARNKDMPFIIKQVRKLKRLNYNALDSFHIINSVNPVDMHVSYAYVKKIRSRDRHGYYEREKINRNRHLLKLGPTIVSHIIETTIRYDGLNSSKNVQHQIQDIFNLEISARSVRRKRHLFSFRRRRTTKKPYLSPTHRAARYDR